MPLLALGTAFLLEFGLFFGVILALAGWELYRMHKLTARKPADEERDNT